MGTTLHTLSPPPGARRSRKRKGRGPGSGNGKTAGRGHKGQNARSGGGVRPGFEGGQMPLQRRLPKRGFKNIFARELESVNVDTLAARFEAGAVDPDAMRDAGVVPRKAELIKVLGRGAIDKALQVKAHAFSKSAEQKITAAGGSIEIIPRRKKYIRDDKADKNSAAS